MIFVLGSVPFGKKLNELRFIFITYRSMLYLGRKKMLLLTLFIATALAARSFQCSNWSTKRNEREGNFFVAIFLRRCCVVISVVVFCC
jgi:hypothetical protein